MSSSFSLPSSERPSFSLLLASRGVTLYSFSKVEFALIWSLSQKGGCSPLKNNPKQTWCSFFKDMQNMNNYYITWVWYYLKLFIKCATKKKFSVKFTNVMWSSVHSRKFFTQDTFVVFVRGVKQYICNLVNWNIQSVKVYCRSLWETYF